MTSSLEVGDKLAAEVAVTKRITLDDIKAEIVGEEYFYSGTLTLCVLKLKCGYQAVGKSACMYPENYNKELGNKFAKEDAMRDVWALEAYAWMKNK